MPFINAPNARWLMPLVLMVSAACGGSEDEGRTTEDPVTSYPEATATTARYALSTEVDLTKVSAWSEKVDASLAPLDGLGSDPAKAIFDALEDNPLSGKIPGALESKFRDWFNAELLAGKIDGVDAPGVVAKFHDTIKSMTGKFEVLSTLEMLPNGKAKHSVKGLAFDVGGEHIEVPTDGVTEELEAGADRGKTTFGGHTLNIPIGDLAGKGLDLLDKDKLLKAGIRAVLGQFVDCDGIAKNVSQKCVGALCVGHEPEIEQVCNKGLDAVAGLTLTAMKKLNLDPLTLLGGSANILGGGGGLDGVWDGALDLGKGLEIIKPKFTGKLL